MSLKDLIKELNNYDPSLYEGINKDNLLVYGLNVLIERSIPTTFEHITVLIFKLFPTKFSMVGFSQYPDTALVNRTLLHCRPKYKNLIVGSVSKSFALTKKGKYVARQMDEQLNGGAKQTPQRNVKRADRTYTGAELISQIETSKLFKCWESESTEDVGDYDIWALLKAVPYTDKPVLKEIMRGFRHSAEIAKRKDIEKFLDWVESKYQQLFN